MLRNRKENNVVTAQITTYTAIEEPIGDAIFAHYINEKTKLVYDTYPGPGYYKIYHDKNYRVYGNNRDYKIFCHNYSTYLRYCKLQNRSSVSKLEFYLLTTNLL